MITTLTTSIIGFSIWSCAVLLVAYLFFLPELRKTLLGRIACACLLMSLIGLQLGHLNHVQTGIELFATLPYRLTVLATPAAFFYFSREELLPESGKSPWLLIHLLPLAFGALLPADLVIPAIFVIGAAYTVWFARIVYGLRRHLPRYRFEMFFAGLFALLAVLILVMVMLIPRTGSGVFYLAYANFIGFSMLLVMAALVVFPELSSDISDAARLAYSVSTLNDVDSEAKLRQLDRLMTKDKLFANENLNLGLTAQALELSSHQLSELINTRFGHGFSRFVREQRVSEAQRLLLEEPDVSVLAIGMSVGFRSQSNFYTAFREITGQTPGHYRNSNSGRR